MSERQPVLFISGPVVQLRGEFDCHIKQRAQLECCTPPRTKTIIKGGTGLWRQAALLFSAEAKSDLLLCPPADSKESAGLFLSSFGACPSMLGDMAKKKKVEISPEESEELVEAHKIADSNEAEGRITKEIVFALWREGAEEPEAFKITEENYEEISGCTIGEVTCLRGLNPYEPDHVWHVRIGIPLYPPKKKKKS